MKHKKIAVKLPFIFDIGAHTIRFGQSGCALPLTFEPAVLGKLTRPLPVTSSKKQAIFPIAPDARLDSVDIEPLVTYDNSNKTYSLSPDAPNVLETLVADYENPIIYIVEPTLENQKLREELCEIVFEQFKASAIFFSKACVVSAFAMGKTSATVLDLGHARGTAAVVNDSGVMKNGVYESHELGGDFVNEIIKQKLFKSPSEYQTDCPPLFTFPPKRKNERFAEWLQKSMRRPPAASEMPFLEPSYSAWSRQRTLEIIKELHIEIIPKKRITEQEVDGVESTSLTLPDGTSIETAQLSEDVTNHLFNGTKGIGACLKSAMTGVCPGRNYPDVCSSFVLVGGLSVMEHLLPKLSEEFLTILPEISRSQNASLPWKCYCFEKVVKRKNAAWIGASILGSLGNFPSLCYSSSDYEARGPINLSAKF